ncbi:MAG: mechanosensitive ion channel family protein [Gammaproteobacteria bacterium]
MESGALWVTLSRAAVIVVVAMVIHVLARRAVDRLGAAGHVSSNTRFIAGAVVKWSLTALAAVAVMQQFGVSVQALWTALSAVFVLVAVGFVALWSVLSNMLCALFLVLFAPFRIGDRIEVIEVVLNDGSKRGIRGKVLGIDLVYTTLQDDDGSTVRIPNNMLFQRAIRTVSGAETRSLGSDLFDAGQGPPRARDAVGGDGAVRGDAD